MNIIRLIAVFTFAIGTMAAAAQKQKVRIVVDGDTGQGIPNVSITGKGFTIVTDSLGRFVLPNDCKTLVFSHLNYTSYLANVNDIGDYVALYPNYQQLDEVMVFGTPGKNPLEELNSQLKINKTDAQLMTANPNGNLLGLFKYLIPKKWRTSKKKKREEELKKLLEEY